MDKKFIDQAHDIVINNIADEKFGAQKLASLLNLSTAQTLRKIRATTGKSVNQYIRELRLKEAAKLLKKTDLTITEISYKVGFGSHTYFNAAFRKLYGITPGEYKTQNKSLSELESEKTKKRTRSVSSWKKAFYFISILMIVGIGYLLINKSSSKNTSKPNSIAVLPFRDMSPEDTQWFCDGISDNILTYLSQIKDLTVISFTSSSTFRETDKTTPEIAKQLGVSYILEGSVTVYEDKIKINAQLINANDEHVWSEDYTENFDNVIGIQQNIAKEIAGELKITLSPEEEIALEKYPTDNMEAYHLFLKGQLINDSRKVEDLKLNIELNKQAIALDSNYADAYAEIAHSYFLLAYYGEIIHKVAFKKSNYYADKALKIDPNSYRAWAVKAILFHFIDWDKAKEYHEKAIALNPNDATARFQYASYLRGCPNPDLNNHLHQLTIAQRLNPFSWIIGRNFTNALISNNKFKEAEEYNKKMKFLFPERDALWHQSLIIAYKNKDWTKVIPFFKAKIEKDPNNSILYRMLGDAYDGILNDDSTAIKYLKKAYEIDSTNYRNAQGYLVILAEGKKFKEAKKLLQSKNFKSVLSEPQQLRWLWYYYYHHENYKKALEVSNNKLITDKYNIQVLTYAQLGDRKKVDIMNKNYYLGVEGWSHNTQRAFVYAILKERDSMYYYLEKAKFEFKMRWANGRREFDPYRNEERFKALLREHYLPVPSE